jgi:hypothetical protein
MFPRSIAIPCIVSNRVNTLERMNEPYSYTNQIQAAR